jgi:hypothetical protein
MAPKRPLNWTDFASAHGKFWRIIGLHKLDYLFKKLGEPRRAHKIRGTAKTG